MTTPPTIDRATLLDTAEALREPRPPLGARVSALIRISEIYGPVIQGEGSLIGIPTVFVRTGGCDYRCAWCDTLHAVLPEYRRTWVPTPPEAILTEVRRLAGDTPLLITLSGGNPALQPLGRLLDLGHDRGYPFALETQASVARPWFAQVDHLVLSPKPPSSGEHTSALDVRNCLNAAAPREIGAKSSNRSVTLKIVIFTDADLDYALALHREFLDTPMALQVGNPEVPGVAADPDPDLLLGSLAHLSERLLARRVYDVRVLPQLHVLLYGNRRGV